MPAATPAEVRAMLPAFDGGGDDALTAQLIARADALIAAALGRPAPTPTTSPTLASTSYVLYTGEGADADGRDLHLDAWPCTAVASVYDDPEEAYGASTLVASTDYAITPDGRALRLKPTATLGGWTADYLAVKATVTAGWTTLPHDLLHALALLVQHLYAQRAGIQTAIDGAGVRISNQPRALPNEVRQAIAPYLDMRAGVR